MVLAEKLNKFYKSSWKKFNFSQFDSLHRRLPSLKEAKAYARKLKPRKLFFQKLKKKRRRMARMFWWWKNKKRAAYYNRKNRSRRRGRGKYYYRGGTRYYRRYNKKRRKVLTPQQKYKKALARMVRRLRKKWVKGKLSFVHTYYLRGFRFLRIIPRSRRRFLRRRKLWRNFRAYLRLKRKKRDWYRSQQQKKF